MLVPGTSLGVDFRYPLVSVSRLFEEWGFHLYLCPASPLWVSHFGDHLRLQLPFPQDEGLPGAPAPQNAGVFPGVYAGAFPVATGNTFTIWIWSTSLVVQWLRLWAPKAAGQSSNLGWGTRSHVLQLKIPYANWRPHILQLKNPHPTTKTWHSLNKEITAFSNWCLGK